MLPSFSQVGTVADIRSVVAPKAGPLEAREAKMADKDQTQRGAERSADGKLDNAKGKLKDAAGGLTGDTGMQAEGKMDQAKGKVKDAMGEAERKLDRNT